MKTNHIALTMLASAALMLSACVNESELKIGGGTLNKDEIAFKMGVTQVRSAAKAGDSESVQLGTISTTKGSLIFEETVESLDGALATRGTPVFTANAEDVHGTFSAVGSGSGKTFPDASYAWDGEEFWKHHYAGMGDLWDGNVSYQFFMRMPGNVPGVTGGGAGITNNTDGSMAFDYVSPASAEGQEDILFTSATVTQNGEDIVFYHALTGVKFANYFDNKGIIGSDGETRLTTKTIIKNVTISGLYSKGTCTVNPSASGSKSADKVSWNNLNTRATFSIDPTDTTNYKNSTVGLDTLLNATAKARNLNDDDGSLTFWFIPQSLARTETDSVTISVTFDVYLDNVKTFSDTTMTITLSDYLSDSHRTWTAGQLHTFTLRPTAIKVEIDDELTEYVKSDVVVENKGNVYEYVRVNIIGNWVGKVCIDATSPSEPEDDEDLELTYSEEDDIILVGYPDNNRNETTGEYTSTKMRPLWNDKDFYSDGTYRAIEATSLFMSPYTAYGEFVDLPCMADEPASGQPVGDGGTIGNWIRHDKYYYYKKAIGPGDSVTEDLFKSYTVGVSPEFWIADKWGTRRPALNVHLEMDLAVQSIEAPMNPDGTEASDYKTAWTKILNTNNDPDFNINDL